MRPDQIIKELLRQKDLLEQKDDSVKELAENKANAEMDYRIAVASEVARLRMKSVSVSLSDALARGDPVVAGKKRDSIKAEEIMKACFKSMDNIRTIIDLLRSLLSHESKERFSRNV